MLGIIIAIFGVAVFLYGILITFGFLKTDVSKDLAIDKKLFSEQARYFLARYSGGIRLMSGGAAAIFLGTILYLYN